MDSQDERDICILYLKSLFWKWRAPGSGKRFRCLRQIVEIINKGRDDEWVLSKKPKS